MAKATITIDMAEVGEVLDEIVGLAGRMPSLPKHVERRLDRLRDMRARGELGAVVELRSEARRLIAIPGPELLCLLVDLRVLAGQR